MEKEIKELYEQFYIAEADKTIIFKYEKVDGKVIETISGFYYGSPNNQDTKKFLNKNKAVWDDYGVFEELKDCEGTFYL